MSPNLVIKDAFWQILGRILSAIAGLLVIKMITPFLGPERYGDYSTILKYFAIWAAFADFGLYVVALQKLGKIKEESYEKLQKYYAKFVSTRFFMIFCVYTLAIIIAYLIPAYSSNPYIVWGLPLGMLFSASFMVSGILQAPLQLFWQMKHLSIALVLARIGQLGLLVFIIFYLFPQINFDGGKKSILVFSLIIFSVLFSGILQIIYVYIVGRKYLPLKRNFDIEFTKNIFFNNRKYGLAYYLSSFHTLVVLISLSIFFPTTENFTYVGIWALALSLLEILLIVPQSLGNALIHKISTKIKEEKLISYGYMMIFTIWIGLVFMINFMIFGQEIIYFIGGNDYIGNGQIGSDYILYFLGIVIVLSFIKQIFNYIFVSNNLQNNLLFINGFGVFLGLIIGIPLILNYNIIGGIITQILLEVLFVVGALFVAWKNNSLPKVNIKVLFTIIFIMLGILLFGQNLLQNNDYTNFINFILYVIIINILILLLSYYPIKNIMRNLG
ncbi:oligosaccharide flippase family protein [Candidatus Vampirococcus lugosii]|uniref:Membrane protein involved in the export of O-antigen and teichoic acid n=1 Tax=Candidatus Vampirococcus lugosii TaxID=2789015 RepID=A0ABS5QL34_9BACT|nr:oligosaccharide flippase family protein [Candidatus Vampirococcus lugosii]MBS8121882.1 Membrane protein involved in the export of O-antigen and teichoic acid [Candidatus Vampirococcus lugosii]